MEQAKRDELIALVKAQDVHDAKVLEHLCIFGTKNMSSVVHEEGMPFSEHYQIEELQAVINEAFSTVE